MGRLVRLKVIKSEGRATGLGGDEESYAERAAKYVPAEIVAGYAALDGILSGVSDTDPLKHTAVWALFVLGLVITPVYLYTKGRPSGQQWGQIVISTIAFAIWVYTLGGPFAAMESYRPWLGGLLVGTWTFLSGLFQPKVYAPVAVATAT